MGCLVAVAGFVLALISLASVSMPEMCWRGYVGFGIGLAIYVKGCSMFGKDDPKGDSL